MNNRRHLVSAAALVIVATVLLRIIFGWMFALPYPDNAEVPQLLYYLGFATPSAASAQAVPVDGMFNAHYWMISFLFGLILVFMLYSVVVFRRKPGDTTDAAPIHGNTRLEVTWTVVPVFVVLGFGVYGAVVLNDITSPDPNEMVVRVTGRQWAWSFEYPEQDDVNSNALVLPINQPVLLEMEAEDVIHSFWVPEFRVKQDLVPGRTTYLRITPTELGDYVLRCAEICGTEHANMLAPVRVVDDAGFAQFIEDNRFRFSDLTPEARGELWASTGYYGCVSCHSIDGSDGVGPTWLGLYQRQEQLQDGSTVVADEEYIRNSILNPNEQLVAGYAAAMPQNYEELFAEREAEILEKEGAELDIIDDLIAYIKTLEE